MDHGHVHGTIHSLNNIELKSMLYESIADRDISKDEADIQAFLKTIKEAPQSVRLEGWKGFLAILCSLWIAACIDYDQHGSDGIYLKKTISMLDTITDEIPDICESISVSLEGSFVDGFRSIITTLKKDDVSEIRRIEYTCKDRYILE